MAPVVLLCLFSILTESYSQDGIGLACPGTKDVSTTGILVITDPRTALSITATNPASITQVTYQYQDVNTGQTRTETLSLPAPPTTTTHTLTGFMVGTTVVTVDITDGVERALCPFRAIRQESHTSLRPVTLKQTTVTPIPFKHTTEDEVHDQMFSNTPQACCPCTPQNQTGLVTGLAVGMVLFIILFVVDFSIHINYRRKSKSKNTPSSDDAPVYQNVPDPKRQPGRQDIQIIVLDKPQPSDAYQSLDPKTMSATQSEYQSLNNKAQNGNQSTDAYQSLDPKTMSATQSEYQSLNNKGQKDSTL